MDYCVPVVYGERPFPGAERSGEPEGAVWSLPCHERWHRPPCKTDDAGVPSCDPQRPVSIGHRRNSVFSSSAPVSSSAREARRRAGSDEIHSTRPLSCSSVCWRPSFSSRWPPWRTLITFLVRGANVTPALAPLGSSGASPTLLAPPPHRRIPERGGNTCLVYSVQAVRYQHPESVRYAVLVSVHLPVDSAATRWRPEPVAPVLFALLWPGPFCRSARSGWLQWRHSISARPWRSPLHPQRHAVIPRVPCIRPRRLRSTKYYCVQRCAPKIVSMVIYT